MAWRKELELMVTQMPLGCSFCFLSVGLLSFPPPLGTVEVSWQNVCTVPTRG